MAHGLAYQKTKECNLKQIDQVYLYTRVDLVNSISVFSGAIYCRLWLEELEGKPAVEEFTLL